MTVTFTESAAANRPPYADWEREMRPAQARDTFTLRLPDGRVATVEWPLFRPVYVRVTGDTPAQRAQNARALLDLATGMALLLLGDDACLTLQHIVARDGHVQAHQTRLFLHLCEIARAAAQVAPFCAILHTGPAVPGLSPGDLFTTAAPPVSVPRQASTDTTAVVTAIVDTEIAIAHERFRAGPLSTRIRHFWRQQRESYAGIPGLTIGREIDAAGIDALLTAAQGDERRFYTLLRDGGPGQGGADAARRTGLPSRADLAAALEQRALSFLAQDVTPTTDPDVLALLGHGRDAITRCLLGGPSYLMSERPPGFARGHGTWVADLAAGYPAEDARTDRPVVAVELPDYAVADTAGQRLEVFVLMALRRILHWCDNWNGTPGHRVPVVVNISLGNTAGPKDGTGFLEAEIATLVRARNAEGIATRVVMAAGNTFRGRLTAQFTLRQGQEEAVDWCVQPDDRSPSFVELRLPADGRVALSIAPPGGAAHTVTPGHDCDLWHNGHLVGRLYQPTPQQPGCTVLALAPTQTPTRMGPVAPAGAWRIGFANAGADGLVRLDVQRDDTPSGWPVYGRQSWLDHPLARAADPQTGDMDLPRQGSPVARTHTLSAHATGSDPAVLVVGSAMARHPDDPGPWQPSLYTASGPSFGVRTTPDLSAVSEDGAATPGLLAAGYMSGSTAVFCGTSGAAPKVTRAMVEAIAAAAGGLPGDAIAPPDLRLGLKVLEEAEAPGRPLRRPWLGR